jgi:hypothetical protein
MHHLKQYFYWSLGFHACLLLIASIVSMWHSNKKNAFVVFGARSRYEAKTQYKSAHITPFMSSRKKSRNSGSPQHSTGRTNKKNSRMQLKKNPKQQTKKASVAKKNTVKKQSAPTKAKKQTKKNIPEIGRKKRTKISGNKKVTPPVKNKHKKSKQKPKQLPKEKVNKIAPPQTQPEPELAIEQSEQESAMGSEPKEVAENSLEESTKTQRDNLCTEDTAGPDETEGFSIEGDYDPQTLAQFQYHVQKEIDRLWHPPIGVPKGTVCSIFFVVDNTGAVVECNFAKRSPVLIYDLGIMRIARELQFHESLWGKQFKIDFCQ